MANAWGTSWGSSWGSSWGAAAEITGAVDATEVGDTVAASATVGQGQEPLLRFGLPFEQPRRRRYPPITAELVAGERPDGLIAFGHLGFDPELIDADFLAIAA